MSVSKITSRDHFDFTIFSFYNCNFIFIKFKSYISVITINGIIISSKNINNTITNNIEIFSNLINNKIKFLRISDKQQSAEKHILFGILSPVNISLMKSMMNYAISVISLGM